MVNVLQKNMCTRGATLASLTLLACLAVGFGCGAMYDAAYSELESQQQAVVIQQKPGVAEAAGKELPDKSDDPIEAKSDWNLHAHSPYGGSGMNVRWTARPGDSFKLCWKKTSDSGTVCGNHKVDITAGGSNCSAGTVYAGFPTECGGVEYKIRVKYNAFSYRTIYKKTSACNTANACPYGGWFDGANCQIGQAPTGTNAFIYQGAYYYSYAGGATKCPLAGSFDDGANCFVQWIPSGVNPFIYLNHWYYAAYP